MTEQSCKDCFFLLRICIIPNHLILIVISDLYMSECVTESAVAASFMSLYAIC